MVPFSFKISGKSLKESPVEAQKLKLALHVRQCILDQFAAACKTYFVLLLYWYCSYADTNYTKRAKEKATNSNYHTVQACMLQGLHYHLDA